MTYEKAIGWMMVKKQCIIECPDDANDASKEIIEAYNMAIEALEKQIPKKPIKKKMKIKDCIDQIRFFEETVCPSCGERMCCDWKFCFECGQSIDWGE